MHVAVLNGPNLNRLGRRPAEQYGTETLEQLEQRVRAHTNSADVTLTFVQSNHEGVLIDRLYDLVDDLHGVIVNPAGLTTYGRSLADALAECGSPYAVVHLSQPYRWRSVDMVDVFRERSALYICGLGWRGYTAALDGLIDLALARPE